MQQPPWSLPPWVLRKARQLHAAACRLVHFAAAASPAQLAAAPALADWGTIMRCFCSSAHELWTLRNLAPDAGPTDECVSLPLGLAFAPML